MANQTRSTAAEKAVKAPVRRQNRPSFSRLFEASTRHAVALFITALYLLPLLFIIFVALTPKGESADGSIPSRFAWANFVEAMNADSFGLFFFNSVLVTVISTIVQVLLACMAGYALAKMPVRGSKNVMLLLIALLVVPPEIIMVPLFVLVAHVPLFGGNNIFGMGGMGLLDSYFALILPHIASAMGIFLMRQFYLDLPDELGQAARVDGASEWRIFAGIYTPLAKPAVATVTVLAFQSTWNDFLWPLVVVKSNNMRTLQLGLTVFYQENSTQWNYLMSAVILITIPIALIFLYGQRYFTSGITSGGVKQ